MNRAASILVSVVILLGLLAIFFLDAEPAMQVVESSGPFREMLWENRSLDLIGQMMIILAGTFGVLILTKERIEG